MLCFPRLPSEKAILREIGKLRSNHAVKFSKTALRHAKIRERKSPSLGVMQKCVLQERIPSAPKFEERTQDETQHAPAETPGNWQRKSVNSKMESRETFCSPAEVWVMSAFFSTNPEEREFVIDSGASMHMLNKKDPSSGELETLRRSRNRITVVTATGEVHTNEEAQVYVHDLHLYVTVQ